MSSLLSDKLLLELSEILLQVLLQSFTLFRISGQACSKPLQLILNTLMDSLLLDKLRQLHERYIKNSEFSSGRKERYTSNALRKASNDTKFVAVSGKPVAGDVMGWRLCRQVRIHC